MPSMLMGRDTTHETQNLLVVWRGEWTHEQLIITECEECSRRGRAVRKKTGGATAWA